MWFRCLCFYAMPFMQCHTHIRHTPGIVYTKKRFSNAFRCKRKIRNTKWCDMNIWKFHEIHHVFVFVLRYAVHTSEHAHTHTYTILVFSNKIWGSSYRISLFNKSNNGNWHVHTSRRGCVCANTSRSSQLTKLVSRPSLSGSGGGGDGVKVTWFIW